MFKSLHGRIGSTFYNLQIRVSDIHSLTVSQYFKCHTNFFVVDLIPYIQFIYLLNKA
jgi:hypothetical protein